MRVGRRRKDPDSISLHTIDWSRWLTKRGAAILTSVWALGTLSVGALETNDTTTASVTLAAVGAVGDVVEITNTITTDTGLKEDAILVITITEE